MRSAGAARRRDPSRPVWAQRTDLWLGLSIASIPLGSGLVASEVGLPISWSLIAGVVGLATATLTRSPGPGVLVVLGLGCALLPGTLVSGDVGSSFLTWFQMVAGLGCGSALAVLLRSGWARVSVAALALFLAVTCLQMALNFFGVTGPREAHQLSLSWGASNYVSAIVVLVGFELAAHLLSAGRRRPAALVLIFALASSLSVLSRGSTLAVVAGLGVAALSAVRSPRARVATACVTAPAVAVSAASALSRVSDERGISSVASSADTAQIRFRLWGEAWRQFTSSPLVGTGFNNLRSFSSDRFGVPISFAHNLPLSLLQQAGVFSVPLIILLTRKARRSWRSSEPLLRGGIAALLCLVLVEPVIEGFAGAMIAGVLLFSCNGAIPRGPRVRAATSSTELTTRLTVR